MNNLTFKRFGVLFLVLTIVVGILAACAPNKSDTTTPGNDTSASATANSTSADTSSVPEKPEEITLTIYGGADPAMVPEDASQTAIGKIIKEKFNIKMEVLPVPGNYSDLVTLWLSSGDYPDILRITSLPLLNQYIEAGVAVCFDDYAGLLPNFLSAHADQLDLWRKQSSDGKLYKWENGTPVSMEGQLSDYDLMVRSDILEQQGWPEIIYASDLFNFYKTAVEKNPTSNGQKTIGVTFCGGESPDYTIYPFNLVDKSDKYQLQPDFTLANYVDNRYEYAWENPQLKESAQFFNRLYQAGLLDKESYSLKDADVLEKMKNGQVISSLYTRWNTIPANSALGSKGLTNMEYVELPIRLDSQKGTKRIQVVPATKAAENRILSKNCKNIERVLALLDWWSTDEAQLLYGSGIKGVDYEYKDGKRTPLEPFANFLKGNNPTWPYEGGYLESFLFTYLGARYDNYKGDNQPFRLTKDPAIVSQYGLSERQAQVYKALGWPNAKSWYYDNAVVFKDSNLAATSIPNTSQLFDTVTASKEILFRYSSKIVFSKNDAAFEKNWNDFLKELDSVNAKSIVDEKNRLLKEVLGK